MDGFLFPQAEEEIEEFKKPPLDQFWVDFFVQVNHGGLTIWNQNCYENRKLKVKHKRDHQSFFCFCESYNKLKFFHFVASQNGQCLWPKSKASQRHAQHLWLWVRGPWGGFFRVFFGCSTHGFCFGCCSWFRSWSHRHGVTTLPAVMMRSPSATITWCGDLRKRMWR